MGAEAKETSTRTWSYTVIGGLAKGARERLKEARTLGAAALAEEALEISDRMAGTAAEAASNRLAVDTRKWLAGVLNREDYGDSAPKVEIGFSVGGLHLDALRQTRITAKVELPRLGAGQPDYEVVENEE